MNDDEAVCAHIHTCTECQSIAHTYAEQILDGVLDGLEVRKMKPALIVPRM